MRIVERLNADEEIRELRKQLKELTGRSLPFNYDCYGGIDEYKEHLRECVRQRKIVIREKDRQAAHRFDSMFEKRRSDG